MDKKNKNLGQTMMILQEQYNHQKRLSEIYLKNPVKNSNRFTVSISNQHFNNKKQKIKHYESQQHLKNIKKLVKNITRQKSMIDRLKDQNDFYAYPALFFREIVKNPVKKTKVKKVRRKTVNYSVPIQPEKTEDISKISIQKIRQFLPILTHYDQQDWQEWTDSVNKLIITFDLVDKVQLEKLTQKLLDLLPKSCTNEFRSAAVAHLRDICNEI